MTDLPRFVVGTGRCGSTLLSRMLAEHRDVASIHEFFTGLDWGRRFARGDVTGDELAELLSAEQPVTTQVIGLGYTSAEITYPFSSTTRWQPGEPIPWLLVSMMSWLTDDPDGTFDRFIDHARSAPTRPVAQHYPALFDWLATTAGASIWVERSGSSIDYVAGLAEVFPGARFVHIHRDGLEAAESIRAHPFFRVALAILFQLVPPEAMPGADGDLRPMFRWAIEHAPPVEVAGRYWSDQVLRGYAALPGLDADQWLDVRFEDVVTDPRGELGRVAAFLDLPDDDGFVERGADLVAGLPPSRAAALDPGDRERLAAACRPGQVLLGRAT